MYMVWYRTDTHRYIQIGLYMCMYMWAGANSIYRHTHYPIHNLMYNIKKMEIYICALCTTKTKTLNAKNGKIYSNTCFILCLYIIHMYLYLPTYIKLSSRAHWSSKHIRKAQKYIKTIWYFCMYIYEHIYIRSIHILVSIEYLYIIYGWVGKLLRMYISISESYMLRTYIFIDDST